MTGAAIFSADERDSFTRSVDRFVEERYGFDRQREIAASADGFGHAEWRDMADLGWMALPLPEDAGGLGGGMQETAIVMAGIGRGLLLEPYLATVVLAGGLIAACADEPARSDLLSAIAAGEAIWAFADTDGDDPVLALPDGEGWRIGGTKTLVLHGHSAGHLLVSARTADGTGLFMVDADAPGVERRRFDMVDGRGVAEIGFGAAPAVRLGNGDAAVAIVAAHDRAAVALCSEAVGAMAALNAMTLDYARTRQQFGVAIGSFQALQHRLVDMAVAETEARSVAAAAAEALDAGHPMASMVVSAAKIRINRAGRFVGESAIQLHGGIGMTNELAAGHYFKRLLAIGSLFGDCDMHLDRLASAA